MQHPKWFSAPWITSEEIAEVIGRIHSKFPACLTVPVDALSFAEHDLGFEFHFKPIKDLGQDAFLLRDFSGIVFDLEAFSQSNSNRLNFSVAHELGHFYLHKAIYGSEQFKSIEEWLDFVERVPPAEYRKIEWQADEFAGQFLMPLPAVSSALNETIADAQREGYFSLGQEAVLDFCCQSMKRDFKVSQQALRTRILRSKLWPHPSAPRAAN